MSENESARSADVTAMQLHRNLNEFALVGVERQRALLPDLLTFIQQYATEELVEELVDPEFQAKLTKATNLTLETSLELNGKLLNPWIGSYTLVVVNTDGSIRGAVSKRPKDMEPYGNSNYNFHAPALAKAIASLHLDTAGLKGGIANNWKYLKDLGFPYHAGGTEEPAYVGLSYSGGFIGGSGCEASMEALSQILDGATPTHFTQAGTFDSAFAELTAYYLKDIRRTPLQPTPIPPSLERLVAGN